MARRDHNDPALEKPREPGWYPDPWSATGEGQRYFDGQRWGSSEKPLGRHSTEPIGLSGGRRRGSRFRTLVVVVVLGALVAYYYQPWTSQASDSASSASAQLAALDRPPVDGDRSPVPLGVPAAAPVGRGGFEVSLHQTNDPAVAVGFDPCRPIHYVVDPKGAPDDGDALIAQAITRLQIATGLQFVADGPTVELPTKERAPYLPSLYDPDRWAPVLIAWSDEVAYPSLAGYIAGVAGPVAVYSADHELVYVSGEVVLDSQQLSATSATDRAEALATILHELGHLVGLDHTSDRDQLMFSEAQQFLVSDYGPGDLRGLALMGSQACHPGI